MYEIKKNGKVFTSKSVGTGPSSYKKRIYRAAVSQRLRNIGIDDIRDVNKQTILTEDLRGFPQTVQVIAGAHYE